MKKGSIRKWVCKAVFDVGKPNTSQIELNVWEADLIAEPRGKIT